MKIFEVDMGMAPTPNPAQLSGLVQFLNGRATDTNAKKEISHANKRIAVPIYKAITNGPKNKRSDTDRKNRFTCDMTGIFHPS